MVLILERITLDNIGVYRGRHEVDLSPPSPDRSVIVIGGCNGEGKTTLLEALQLALHGERASPARRGDRAYADHLRGVVSRGVDPREGAAIEIALRRVVEGKVEQITVRRAWSSPGGRGERPRESLEVRRDGVRDALFTEAWAEQIEEMMPARLSRLFFFDGEKIEALADPDRTAEALRAAVHALLGVDLVDHLVADLLTLERQKRAARRSARKATLAEQQEADAMARLLTHAEREREVMSRFRAALLDDRLRRLEALALEASQRLLRKGSLITGLRIDPRSFALTLHGADGSALSPDRLSSGERQLLAVSILWALARASGRPLPVVIDAPLGRLDSTHRERLIERYFPHASHQVILLCTDEEIDPRRYARLRAHVGRSYLIHHDDRAGTSAIAPGYFF